MWVSISLVVPPIGAVEACEVGAINLTGEIRGEVDWKASTIEVDGAPLPALIGQREDQSMVLFETSDYSATVTIQAKLPVRIALVTTTAEDQWRTLDNEFFGRASRLYDSEEN